MSEALIVTDVQNDFCPGGALAVEGGDEIVPLVNELVQSSEHVILTQDWHPRHHSSFASSHPGKAPFETVAIGTVPQSLGRLAERVDCLPRRRCLLPAGRGPQHHQPHGGQAAPGRPGPPRSGPR